VSTTGDKDENVILPLEELMLLMVSSTGPTPPKKLGSLKKIKTVSAINYKRYSAIICDHWGRT
jgi:hypothetical protein